MILENFTHGRIDPPMDQRVPNPPAAGLALPVRPPAEVGHDGPEDDANPPEEERPRAPA